MLLASCERNGVWSAGESAGSTPPSHRWALSPPSQIVQRATEIALEMVTRHGMCAALGQRTYAPPPETFLPGAATGDVQAAEVTAREIDVAARDIIAEAFNRAVDILKSRRADLDHGAEILLTRETISAEEFPAIRSAVSPSAVGATASVAAE